MDHHIQSFVNDIYLFPPALSTKTGWIVKCERLEKNELSCDVMCVIINDDTICQEFAHAWCLTHNTWWSISCWIHVHILILIFDVVVVDSEDVVYYRSSLCLCFDLSCNSWLLKKKRMCCVIRSNHQIGINNNNQSILLILTVNCSSRSWWIECLGRCAERCSINTMWACICSTRYYCGVNIDILIMAMSTPMGMAVMCGVAIVVIVVQRWLWWESWRWTKVGIIDGILWRCTCSQCPPSRSTRCTHWACIRCAKSGMAIHLGRYESQIRIIQLSGAWNSHHRKSNAWGWYLRWVRESDNGIGIVFVVILIHMHYQVVVVEIGWCGHCVKKPSISAQQRGFVDVWWYKRMP